MGSVNRLPTMSESLPPIIEWFRPDRRREILRVFSIACIVLASGALLVGLANSGMLVLDESGRRIVAIIGACTTLSGPLIAVIGLPMVIGGDDFLALSVDGIVVTRKKVHQLITWSELSEADTQGNVLYLHLEDGSALEVTERFAGIELPELASRINRTQQRALMGLLPNPS